MGGNRIGFTLFAGQGGWNSQLEQVPPFQVRNRFHPFRGGQVAKQREALRGTGATLLDIEARR
jgi:hypothetical protein